MQKRNDRSTPQHAPPPQESDAPHTLWAPLGDTLRTSKSIWLPVGCIGSFSHISPLLSVNDHFIVLTFPPRIRWEGFSPCVCSFLNRMPFAIDDAIARVRHKPGKPAEHCWSTRTECLTGWVMVTIWEQAVTYVDQHLSCPKWWLGSEPLGPQRGQCVPSLAGCRVGNSVNLSNVSPLILELSKKRQLPGTSSAHKAGAAISTAINKV